MVKMQKWGVLFLLGLMAIMVASSLSHAISISPARITLDYAPGVQKEIAFRFDRADIISVYLNGELAPYAKINDPNPNGGPRTVTILLTPPAKLSPGGHSLIVGAIEGAPEGAMVGGRAAVETSVTVNVPYPGVYIEAVLNAVNINVGEKEPFLVTVTNNGQDSVSKVSVKMDIFDSGNNKIAELPGNEKPLGGQSAIDFKFDWDSTAAKAGNYRAVATIAYDGGGALAKEATFRIGSLNVEINSATEAIMPGSISQFFIEIQSDWNSQIPGVYGELKFANKTFKTVVSDLPAWATINLTGYVDASGIAEGGYPAQYIVYYADKMSEKTGKINVTQFAQKPATEKPGAVGGAGLTTTLVIILIVLFAAGLVALALLMVKQRNKQQS